MSVLLHPAQMGELNRLFTQAGIHFEDDRRFTIKQALCGYCPPDGIAGLTKTEAVKVTSLLVDMIHAGAEGARK